MIAFARGGDGVTVHVRGPETRATRLTCQEGWEFFGVELQLGAHLPLFPPSGLADLKDALLPTVSGDRILIGGYYDQPQLARAMRWATGHTPGELRSGIPFLAS